MNYYKVLQRKSDKRWDFTCTNGGKTWSTGYCAGWREWTEEDFVRMPELRREILKLEPLKSKYHCDGHATKEEAVACYRQYKLDVTLNLEGKSHSAQRCLVCDEWTDHFASVDNMENFFLCDLHRTKEEVGSRYKGSSEIISSY